VELVDTLDCHGAFLASSTNNILDSGRIVPYSSEANMFKLEGA
jgi:hypothetical protein